VTSVNEIVLRLLIIDDDLENLALMRQVFETEPVKVFLTADASQGMELVRKEGPDVVLLDLLTPQIGGMKMLESILEIDPGVDVILITGHYSTDSAVEAIQKGACD
jgi:DNA-binding NtrC family response regulator